MDKQKIKQAIVDIEQHDIEDLAKIHEAFLKGNQLNHTDVIDQDDQSHLAESMDVSERLYDQVHDHETHLVTINGMSFHPSDKVQPGAVVVLNGRNLVVSVPTKTFEVDGEKFIGISTQAPIYEHLEGKAAGGEFVFHGRKFHIDKVY